MISSEIRTYIHNNKEKLFAELVKVRSKDGAKLAFVINQNLLQASVGGDGFRKFTIKEKIPVSIESLNDFVEAEPFKDLGVNNKTATIILQKGKENTYPILYKKCSAL